MLGWCRFEFLSGMVLFFAVGGGLGSREVRVEIVKRRGE